MLRADGHSENLSKMDKYLVPVTPSSRDTKPTPKRREWKRSLIELNGKFDSKYRHDVSSLSMQSYSQVAAFPHRYHIDGAECPTHVNWFADGNYRNPTTRHGVSALEFDSKGIYLASVTKLGCLTVHDFDDLYCLGNSKNSTGFKEDETKQVLHISTCRTLDVVRWNLTNQYEVACTSRKSSEVQIFDIGYISSEPIEVLRKRPIISVHGCNVQTGFTDVAFASNDNSSRLFAADLHGAVNIWDRRMSDLPCSNLTTHCNGSINSIKMSVDNQVIFGADNHGMIYTWDLRGGSSSGAFQNNKMGNHSPLTSIKLASQLEKIGSLKAQSEIVSKEILSIDLNPACPYQLAFHLDDGWSGVFDVHSWQVTHIHCPPPPWLEEYNGLSQVAYWRKPSWLPMHSIYAVGSSSSPGLHLLDFYSDSRSPCHVDYSDDLPGMPGLNSHKKENIFIPLPEDVTACAAHPANGAIVAGTKESSLLLISQTFTPSREADEIPKNMGSQR